ncbi:GntR family transcriptional regulator [Nesterenkonia sp. PF2B19]|uniref:GntR family transcriptional regulator n=1 Tax=Nesterenkonia sp. PF2B19 TaxID=1881858 RepID=UPI000A19CEA1|nr:GntR family transcriptional regulator [Nesterenkonia sp. PF2B19]OSM43124.1 hypothetical protein BCY76_010145 [Nesterenkonia sp. PF2B19]
MNRSLSPRSGRRSDLRAGDSDATDPGARVARRALRDEVYSALFDRILDGSAPAGSSMSIDALARELDVSPTPVREALVQLEHTGLVTRVALKGYRVAPQLSGQQLRELFEMRMIVEMAAVERAAERAAALTPVLRAAHDRHGPRRPTGARPADPGGPRREPHGRRRRPAGLRGPAGVLRG